VTTKNLKMLSKKMLLITFIAIITSVTFSSCEKEYLCSLKPEPGNCNASFSKYYFDDITKRCEVFTWGGCGGVVPFNTREECEACGCK
jgi:hypothetical protein